MYPKDYKPVPIKGTPEREIYLISLIKSGDLNFLYVDIDEQTDKICRVAIDLDFANLHYVKNQTDDLCVYAINKSPHALQYVNSQTEELCLLAVENTGSSYALKYVKNQTEEICLAAVKTHPYVLQYVKNQTEDMCLASVEKNGLLLQDVKKQTEEICFSAIKQNALAIKYVKNQTPKMCSLAIMLNPISFIYVDECIYLYNKHEILNCYNYIMKLDSPDTNNDFSSKLNSILNRLDDDCLIKAMDIDLKDVINNQLLLKNNSNIFDNLKLKVKMLKESHLELNKPKIIKPKII